jgi:flagellum-specific peptidoglycan hydrolase FlgJ
MKFDKLIAFLFLTLLIGCSSNQSVVRTTKSPIHSKNGSAIAAAKKPVIPTKKPTKNTTTKKTVETTSHAKNTVSKTAHTTSKSNPIQSQQTVSNKVAPPSLGNNSKTVNDKEREVANSEQVQVLEATTRVKVTTQMVLDYIEKYKETAKENMIVSGIPASITLGQALLESGSGTGPLSVQANNHFGIKCHKEWTGPSIKYTDDEENECFRKYSDPKQSFKDHSYFLTSRPRYATLFTLEKDDYKAWATGLKAAGYATDPKYPEKLIGLIERYQLSRFDAEVLGKGFIPLNTTLSSTIASSEQLYTVSKGDTLYSISKKFNLSIDELKRKNNLSDNSLSLGQTIVVK